MYIVTMYVSLFNFTQNTTACFTQTEEGYIKIRKDPGILEAKAVYVHVHVARISVLIKSHSIVKFGYGGGHTPLFLHGLRPQPPNG